MPLPFAILLAGAMLAGEPQGGTAPGRPLSRAQALASAAGQVLGAIAMCEAIDTPRIDAAAETVGAIVERSVGDDEELRAAKALFKKGVAAGGHAVSTGQRDCGAAETDFLAMERSINGQR